MSTPKPPALAPHPAARRTMVVFGLLACLIVYAGISSLASGALLMGGELLALGALVVGTAIFFRALYQGIRISNAAVQRIVRGQLDEAEALLATVPRLADYGITRRAVRTHRALLGLLRGKPDVAVAEATLAVDTHLGLLDRVSARSQRAMALAIRALAHAAAGNAEAARADAAAVEAEDVASPQALAKASVARAVVLARHDRQTELAEHLRANAPLVLEYAEPRERVVVRALMRMSRGAAKSVYREPAKPADQERSALTGFVAMLAPEAAAYVDDARPMVERLEAQEALPASIAHVDALTRVRRDAGKTGRRVGKKLLGLWAMLIVMFLAIWQFLTPAERPAHMATTAVEPEPSPATITTVDVVMWSPVLVLATFIALLVARARRTMRAHLVAVRAAAMGEPEAARRSLWALANSTSPYYGASAWLELARLASRDGQFVDAAKWCEAGLRRVATPALRAAASDLVVPGLMTELAVAQAALGQHDDAAAELVLLARDFPDYAYLPSSGTRVRLVDAARRGDLEACARVARERTAELPLPRREELLADLALAATTTVSDDERHRLAGELADPPLARWVEMVAPNLGARVLGAGRARVAPEAPREPHEPHEPHEHDDAVADEAAARAGASS